MVHPRNPTPLPGRWWRYDDRPLLDRFLQSGELGNAAVSYLCARLLAQFESRWPLAHPEELESFTEPVANQLSYIRSSESTHLQSVLRAFRFGRLEALTFRVGAYVEFLERQALFLPALVWGGLLVGFLESREPVEALRSLLVVGRLERRLARYDEAFATYRAVEVQSQAASLGEMELRGRLGQGIVLRQRGNIPAARDVLAEVLERARTIGLHHVAAMAHADLSAVFALQGNYTEAILATYKVFTLTTDRLERVRSLGNLGENFFELGRLDAARKVFLTVELQARELDTLLWLNARVMLMATAAESLDKMTFYRLARELRLQRNAMPPSMLVDYQYRLGLGYRRFQDEVKATGMLEEALSLAEVHKLNEWVFRIERALAASGEPPAPESAPVVDAQLEEVELQLDVYSATAGIA